MTRITNLVWKLRIWKDTRGQDLIEYALMAGFVAVAAGAIMPGVASSISTIFSQISSVLSSAASPSYRILTAGLFCDELWRKLYVPLGYGQLRLRPPSLFSGSPK